MKCYICDSEMTYIEILTLKMLDKCMKYKCKRCGEVVFKPLNILNGDETGD